jgi:hypothetical protein
MQNPLPLPLNPDPDSKKVYLNKDVKSGKYKEHPNAFTCLVIWHCPAIL